VTLAERIGTPTAPAGRTAPRVVVVGNPNVGKTTVFNALTRQNARVGNYAGVTVECRTGALQGDDLTPAIEVVDVPGAYSLSARSSEEQIALQAVLGLGEHRKPELAVVVLDAGQLGRNLYLALQIVELEVPCVLCLNMMDEVAENPPDPEKLSRLFGVPVVPTNGRSGSGVDELARVVRRSIAHPKPGSIEVPYSPALRPDVDRVAESLPAGLRSSVERDRALARWALTSIDEDDELSEIPAELRDSVLDVRRKAAARDIDQEIIGARYAFLDRHVPTLFAGSGTATPSRKFSDRVDRVLIHPVYGFGIFLCVMMLLFQALFTWADPLIRLVERLVSSLQGLATAALPPGFVRELLVSGVLGGVGNVIVFVPQIVLLFLWIGLLEDSGYMARIAYLMDRVMQSLGLHGRAFVPMLSGYACAIPAILATRTMERRRDRVLTMLVIPLMTCSARLPVYTLIIGALFPPTRIFGWIPLQGLLMIAMYLFATAVALLSAWVLGRAVIPGRRVPLLLELPPYRLPKLGATVRMMTDRTLSFLTEAGTMILACTVLLWLLLSYPKPEHPTDSTNPTAVAQQTIQGSYAGSVGRALEPVIRPLGFDWKIGVGLIGAFAAREVFVSTMGLVYGAGADGTTPLRDRMRAETRADGRPAYPPSVGLSLLAFFAIACQCTSTLAAVRRETRSFKWPALLFAYTGILAWIVSFVVYRIASL
jgi:ferrous iron transport protein B